MTNAIVEPTRLLTDYEREYLIRAFTTAEMYRNRVIVPNVHLVASDDRRRTHAPPDNYIHRVAVDADSWMQCVHYTDHFTSVSPLTSDEVSAVIAKLNERTEIDLVDGFFDWQAANHAMCAIAEMLEIEDDAKRLEQQPDGSLKWVGGPNPAAVADLLDELEIIAQETGVQGTFSDQCWRCDVCSGFAGGSEGMEIRTNWPKAYQRVACKCSPDPNLDGSDGMDLERWNVSIRGYWRPVYLTDPKVAEPARWRTAGS